MNERTDRRLLRFEPFTVAGVPFRVLENAFWRPQAAKLHGTHRRSLDSVSPVGVANACQRLHAAWRLEETWINHALNALLASVPEASLGRVIGDICDGVPPDARMPAKLDSAGIASVTGDPDFILVGEVSCVLGESKVAAKPTSQKYDFQQFTKYQMLGAIIACARDPAIRRDPVHLVVVPDTEPHRFCSDAERWRPSLDDHRLITDGNHLDTAFRKVRFRGWAAWRAFVRDTLLEKRVSSRCELDRARVEQFIARALPFPVPTYVVSWREMMSAVRDVATAEGTGNVARAAEELLDLAHGPGGAHVDELVARKANFAS